jgi:hypothetical protein
VDDLDLLRDPDGAGGPDGAGDPEGDGAPTPRPWRLLAAVLVAALVVLSGLVWVFGSLVGGTDPRPAAASPTATTPAPTAVTTRAPAPTRTVASPARTPFRPIPTIRVPVLPSPTPAPTTRRPTLPPPSPGPLLVRVPDVTGQRLTSATLTLRAAGFKVYVLGTFGPVPETDRRRVSSQLPRGGSFAPKGSTVLLVLDSV